MLFVVAVNNTAVASFPVHCGLPDAIIFSLRPLIAVAKGASAAEVSQLVNTTGVDLLLSDLLSSQAGGLFESLLVQAQESTLE